LKKDSEDIRVLIDKYKFLQAREEDVDAETSLRKYIEMEGVEPTRLLTIKESILKNRTRMQKVRFDILRNYIRVLDSSGLLAQDPLVNYLSPGREVIAP
jgi:hypothetical protein